MKYGTRKEKQFDVIAKSIIWTWRSKRGMFDLGEVWMMVSIQASVSGSNFVNSVKFMLALVVLS
jgi:hypothetical protein